MLNDFVRQPDPRTRLRLVTRNVFDQIENEGTPFWLTPLPLRTFCFVLIFGFTGKSHTQTGRDRVITNGMAEW